VSEEVRTSAKSVRAHLFLGYAPQARTGNVVLFNILTFMHL